MSNDINKITRKKSISKVINDLDVKKCINQIINVTMCT